LLSENDEMPNVIPPPLFADAGAVVGLLVLIFTVVGWLVNLANSQNNPPAAPPPNRPRPPRPKGERVKNEIDIFLQEVRGQTVPQEDVVLESLPPEAVRQRSRPTPPPPPPEPPRPPQRARLGSHVESHVGEALASHHLATNVGDAQPSLEMTDPRTAGEMVALPTLGGQSTKQSSAPIINLFRDRRSIQQAILVNEILSKPKSMRDS
jgi:hypothetical protein